jgi:hypothetical protein
VANEPTAVENKAFTKPVMPQNLMKPNFTNLEP